MSREQLGLGYTDVNTREIGMSKGCLDLVILLCEKQDAQSVLVGLVSGNS